MPIESVSFAPHELFLMHEPIRVSEIYPTTTLLPLLLLLPYRITSSAMANIAELDQMNPSGHYYNQSMNLIKHVNVMMMIIGYVMKVYQKKLDFLFLNLFIKLLL